MRIPVFAILLMGCIRLQAQVPPVIQWQKCIGGTGSDVIASIVPASDGGYMLCGTTSSSDGDFSANYGYLDVFVMKIDPAGNILWRKNYGGSSSEGIYKASSFIATTDGGYIFAGYTGSTDFDVTGYHPGPTVGVSDVWVVKINSVGSIQWQQCYGGSGWERGYTISQAADGGYIVGAIADRNDGDVSGYHGGSNDVWLLKINSTGGLQWQKCIGGSNAETSPAILQTSDGGYFLAGFMQSNDGDITCGVNNPLWFGKLDNAGNIVSQYCQPDLYADFPNIMKQTTDGGYIIATTNFLRSAVTGGPNQGYIEACAIKIDAAGNIQWRRIMGGASSQEHFISVELTADGGYILAGATYSTDGDICINKGEYDIFTVKLRSDGTVAWKQTYGGSAFDHCYSMIPTSDGGFLAAGSTFSDNGDVSGNHNHLDGYSDAWLVKLNFPGIPVLPAINIIADQNPICPGKSVRFIANTSNGGDSPLFTWKINGANAGLSNNDTVFINTIQNGDVVTCALVSNARCLTDPNAVSNSISIAVDPSLTPNNFLFPDTAICKYGTLVLKTDNNFDSYLWNTNATTPSIIVSTAGKYWLDVIKNGCPGTDTVMVTEKQCLQGFFMPTAFTPNNDGKNDLLKPLIAGNLLQYKLIIYNRWGQIIFQSADPAKGWDGKINGTVQDGNVYAWACQYQLAGEEIKNAKGTFVIIR